MRRSDVASAFSYFSTFVSSKLVFSTSTLIDPPSIPDVEGIVLLLFCFVVIDRGSRPQQHRTRIFLLFVMDFTEGAFIFAWFLYVLVSAFVCWSKCRWLGVAMQDLASWVVRLAGLALA